MRQTNRQLEIHTERKTEKRLVGGCLDGKMGRGRYGEGGSPAAGPAGWPASRHGRTNGYFSGALSAFDRTRSRDGGVSAHCACMCVRCEFACARVCLFVCLCVCMVTLCVCVCVSLFPRLSLSPSLSLSLSLFPALSLSRTRRSTGGCGLGVFVPASLAVRCTRSADRRVLAAGHYRARSSSPMSKAFAVGEKGEGPPNDLSLLSVLLPFCFCPCVWGGGEWVVGKYVRTKGLSCLF